MRGLQQWRRQMAVMGLAGLIAVGLGSVAVSQAVAPAKETIFARKILMDMIGRNMDDLEANAASPKIDLTEGRDHADIVSVMLMAFPHMFPPATNQWKPHVDRDPGTDTFAAPEVWSNYQDFYKRAQDATQLAYKASRAETDAAFKGSIEQLRLACDSCHAIYMKKE
jgi:cytochrome c556